MNIFSLLSLVFSLNINDGTQAVNSNIYVYDISSKILGHSTICFALVNDSVVDKKIVYDVYYSAKNKIRRISKNEEIINTNYTTDANNNIRIGNSIYTAYTSKNFSHPENRFNSNRFYVMLSRDFLNMTNNQRLEYIEELFNKIER